MTNKKFKALLKEAIKKDKRINWKEMVKQKYLDEYVADRDEKEIFEKVGFEDLWFSWWIKLIESNFIYKYDMIKILEKKRLQDSNLRVVIGYNQALDDIIKKLKNK